MITLLTDFIGELRAAGIPVSMVEAIDAMEAVKLVDIGDRSALKAALGATLVKNRAITRPSMSPLKSSSRTTATSIATTQDTSRTADSGGAQSDGQSGSQSEIDDLVEALFRAIMGGDTAALQAAARRAVEELAGIEPGRPVGGTYYLYRTLRRLDLEALQERLLEAALAGLDEDDVLDTRPGPRGGRRTDREVAPGNPGRDSTAPRSRSGRQSVARTLRQPLVEDLDSCTRPGRIITDIEDVIEPLTRKLAARLARRRRLLRSGRLDFRKTVRRSLATGGSRWIPPFARRGPIDPRCSCCVTSPVRWPRSPASLFSSRMPWRRSSRNSGASCSSTRLTRSPAISARASTSTRPWAGWRRRPKLSGSTAIPTTGIRWRDSKSAMEVRSHLARPSSSRVMPATAPAAPG